MSVLRVGVRGMSCASCAAGLERALSSIPGVDHADVSYTAELATIEAEPQPKLRELVEQKIHDLGYATADTRREPGDERSLAVRLAITAFFTVTAMMPANAALFGIEGAGSPAALRALAFASGALSLPAVLVGGAPMFVRAWRSIRVPGMDLLVSIGALVAFGLSAVVLARGGHQTYFDTAAFIVLFALVGRVLEARARRRGMGAIAALEALVPVHAHRVDRATQETRDVPTDSLVAGDIVRVRAGERVPVDGVVCEGASLAGTAVLSGEWAPLAIAPGDRVSAGFVLHDGSVVVEVERPAGRREVDLIRRAVESLLTTRPPLQRLADMLSRRLAWLVLSLSVLTLLVVGARTGFAAEAWLRAVAVVVVACPCALGLATPMAIAVAAGRAASRGILFRDAEAIEAAAGIDRVYCDKTGTLTEGRPRVARVLTGAIEPDDLLAVASLLEQAVEHPIARALREAARPAKLAVDIRVTPGGGVTGRGASAWIAGSARFLRSYDIVVPFGDEEATTVHVARDGVWVGLIGFDDTQAHEAKLAIAELERQGMRPVVVTGDTRRSAERLARAVGIQVVHSEVRPLDKTEIVAAARARGERVAFVGDGLNDGPALAAADVGIAVAGATDLAVTCANVVILQGGLDRVPTALAIARAARRAMLQNMGWAIGYNLVAIPLAAFGLLSPAIAAAAMAASSLSVVLSSLRAYPSNPPINPPRRVLP